MGNLKFCRFFGFTILFFGVCLFRLWSCCHLIEAAEFSCERQASDKAVKQPALLFEKTLSLSLPLVDGARSQASELGPDRGPHTSLFHPLCLMCHAPIYYVFPACSKKGKTACRFSLCKASRKFLHHSPFLRGGR